MPQITILDNDPASYVFTDVDGDQVVLHADAIAGRGPGVHLRTGPRGCSIPASDIDAFIRGLINTAGSAASRPCGDDDV